ncbi:MAG: MBL fold metallo-hydrolase [Syntrophobacteraceae bacterium]|nr:MBL fold metallo-hydrolase [Syntrophobacteraceae bacterium]
MVFEHLVVGMLQTNCYILGDEQTRQAVVIDPGGDFKRIADRIVRFELDLVAILNTHAHFDHVADAWSLKSKLGGRIFLHEKDRPILQHSMVASGNVYAVDPHSPSVRIDASFRDGDLLPFGAIRLQVLETPGHTPGHVSFYFADAGIVFVGDTIFAGSIGRTDLPGGSFEQLKKSVLEKIFLLPPDTLILPGHGPKTTVQHEKRTNPFFGGGRFFRT